MYTDSLIFLAPSAKIKLALNSGDMIKLTKKEMCLLLLVSHNTPIEDNEYNKQFIDRIFSDNIQYSLVA